VRLLSFVSNNIRHTDSCKLSCTDKQSAAGWLEKRIMWTCRVEYEVFLKIESILIIEPSYVNPQLAFN